MPLRKLSRYCDDQQEGGNAVPASPDGSVQTISTDPMYSSSATVVIDLTGDSTSSDGEILL